MSSEYIVVNPNPQKTVLSSQTNSPIHGEQCRDPEGSMNQGFCVFSRVFLQHQLWIINYQVKNQSNNLNIDNINTDVPVVFKTKRELKCQNELFLEYNFSGNISIYVFITEII